MAGLVFKNVYKVYPGDVEAVKEFNLEVKDKEFVVFVGPSGCGKSTTLRMLAGLEEISKGEIYIGDTLVNDVPPKDRDIAMVFQNYALYPHMTVYDNMAFALKLKKYPKDEINTRITEAAKILGIEEYLDRKPKALSGGQKQRVALGRAIVRDPQVFLMDEPLSNLDAKLRVQTRAEIIKLHERLETTFIYVTHDQTEAMTMGDRIVIMKDGVIQQVDTPQNVYQNPANVFVAGFIGSPQMNFMEGVLIAEGNNYSIKIDDIKLNISNEVGKELANKGYLNKDIIIGIRPEHIYSEIRKTQIQLNGFVELIEMLGSEKYVYIKLGKYQLISIIDSDINIENHKDIKIYFDERKLHFFDKDTELAIK